MAINMGSNVWPSKTKCQVCSKLPKVLGVNSVPGGLIICEPCDRNNNPYYYRELPPPIPLGESPTQIALDDIKILNNLTIIALGL